MSSMIVATSLLARWWLTLWCSVKLGLELYSACSNSRNEAVFSVAVRGVNLSISHNNTQTVQPFSMMMMLVSAFQTCCLCDPLSSSTQPGSPYSHECKLDYTWKGVQNFSTWHPVFYMSEVLPSLYVKEDHIVVVTCQGNHPSLIHVIIVYVRAQSHKITLLLFYSFVFLGKSDSA